MLRSDEAKPILLVATAGLLTKLPDFEVEVTVSDEGGRSGYMEYFDWLAKTSDIELMSEAHEHGLTFENYPMPMTAAQRHHVGSQVWERM